MPRPLSGRVGRSAGVAEHRVGKPRSVLRLSHTTALTRVCALACVAALALAGAPSAATAQTGAPSLARTRAAIDATASQWFAAQRKVAELDAEIQTLTETLAPTEQRVAQLRHIADARAVELYESNQGLNGVIGGGVMGADPLEVGRRAALIGQANEEDRVVVDELEAAIGDLSARRDRLQAARSAQARTLRDLARRRRTLDTQLASLRRQSAPVAAPTRLAASVRSVDRHTTPDAPAPAPDATLTAAPTAPAETPVPVAPAAAPANSAVNPLHDTPFLVCTRARESNGDYGAVSSNGAYYGAYQFSPTTWNATAVHAGRLDLVGVLPSRAAPYDQDELAWTLYTWQGNSPWGGRC